MWPVLRLNNICTHAEYLEKPFKKTVVGFPLGQSLRILMRITIMILNVKHTSSSKALH